MVLNIGPQHPSTHGVLRLKLVLDGERITSAEPVIGYMHRGAEKLFEARDYRQIVVLANRHDWLCGPSPTSWASSSPSSGCSAWRSPRARCGRGRCSPS
ncbi:NAD(P)H-quinone oxidoreductase subunit H, chloroplastic [Streptomyces violaceorubidus]